MEHNADRKSVGTNSKMDAAVVAALEVKPAVLVPAEFAVRMSMLAEEQPVARPAVRRRYGQMMAWVSLVVLAVAVSLLAPSTLGAGELRLSPLFVVQCVLMVQFLGLALWLGSKRFPGTN